MFICLLVLNTKVNGIWRVRTDTCSPCVLISSTKDQHMPCKYFAELKTRLAGKGFGGQGKFRDRDQTVHKGK
jgi:hypothetical protein